MYYLNLLYCVASFDKIGAVIILSYILYFDAFANYRKYTAMCKPMVYRNCS